MTASRREVAIERVKENRRAPKPTNSGVRASSRGRRRSQTRVEHGTRYRTAVRAGLASPRSVAGDRAGVAPSGRRAGARWVADDHTSAHPRPRSSTRPGSLLVTVSVPWTLHQHSSQLDHGHGARDLGLPQARCAHSPPPPRHHSPNPHTQLRVHHCQHHSGSATHGLVAPSQQHRARHRPPRRMTIQ